MLTTAFLFSLAVQPASAFAATNSASNSASSATNLVSNSGFESGKTGWYELGSSSYTALSTSCKYSGTSSLKVGVGEGGMGQQVTATAGTSYTLSGYGKVYSGETGYLGADCLNSAGTKIPGGKSGVKFSTTSFTSNTVTFTAVPGTTAIQVYTYKNAGSGYAYFDNISLTANTSPIQIQQINSSAKAMWVWRKDVVKILTDAAERSELFTFCSNRGVNVLLMQTNSDCLSDHISQFKSFNADAHSRGIRVEALSGRSAWGLSSGHSLGLAEITRVINFNNSAASAEKFDGVHQDIEVYHGSSWSTDRASCMTQALDYIVDAMSLMNGTGMTYAQDIPRWYEINCTYGGTTKDLYKQIIDRVDWVGIMDYTDGNDSGTWQAVKAASNEISYAATVGKKACAGLDTITASTDGDSETFHEEGLDDLDACLAAIKNAYSSSSGFGGVAVHCYGKTNGNSYYDLVNNYSDNNY
jgi:hypothetical protein